MIIKWLVSESVSVIYLLQLLDILEGWVSEWVIQIKPQFLRTLAPIAI